MFRTLIKTKGLIHQILILSAMAFWGCEGENMSSYPYRGSLGEQRDYGQMSSANTYYQNMDLTGLVDDATSPPTACDNSEVMARSQGGSCQENLKNGDVCLDKLQERMNYLASNGTQYSCAKGVRQTLNALFGKEDSYGETNPATNAKDYNESVLSKWQTSKYKYKEISSNSPPGPLDVRVLHPSSSCPNEMVRKYGHIEFFNGKVWSSDNIQSGSSWSGGRNPCYVSVKVYRLSPK